jgi:exonuclease SbcC
MATLLTRIERTGTQELTARTRAAAGREELAALDGRRTDLRERLDRARGEDDDVRARHRRLSTAAAALAECEAARTAATRAGERLTRAQAAADNAAKAAGFVNRAAAEAAALPEPERRRLAELVAEHEARVSRVRALLEELEAENAADAEQGRHDGAPDSEAEVPQLSVAELMSASMTMTPFAEQLSMFADEDAPVPAAAPVPESITQPTTAAGTAVESAAPSQPDLEAELERLQTALALARAEHEAARERHTLAARAVRALTGLADELERHAKATRPVRRNFATVDSVSKCVEGTGGDNTLRMRLSSYVLAARLEQVADAASLRLASMSGGRYTLVHTDGPSRAGARSGLGLAVIDGWTGVQRDPASLSGGETFCTSLALALGLADVVQAEAGGAVIETLLVDEGFGSLDEDTLDEVMDVLDGLRSAGRAVGLVSHVSDLRDRIPAQLEVVKTRTGSRLIA